MGFPNLSVQQKRFLTLSGPGGGGGVILAPTRD
jgi:hypothetical protein